MKRTEVKNYRVELEKIVNDYSAEDSKVFCSRHTASVWVEANDVKEAADEAMKYINDDGYEIITVASDWPYDRHHNPCCN